MEKGIIKAGGAGIIVAILLILGSTFVGNCHGAEGTIIRPAKIVSVDHHTNMDDTVSVVTADGHMWMFFATPDHTFHVGQVLLVTFKGRRIIDVL